MAEPSLDGKPSPGRMQGKVPPGCRCLGRSILRWLLLKHTLPPQDAVSGQITGCPGQAAVLGYKGTAGLVGEQAGQRKCPLGSSSLEILTCLCQGFGMHDFKKNILVAVNCSLISWDLDGFGVIFVSWSLSSEFGSIFCRENDNSVLGMPEPCAETALPNATVLLHPCSYVRQEMWL